MRACLYSKYCTFAINASVCVCFSEFACDFRLTTPTNTHRKQPKKRKEVDETAAREHQHQMKCSSSILSNGKTFLFITVFASALILCIHADDAISTGFFSPLMLRVSPCVKIALFLSNSILHPSASLSAQKYLARNMNITWNDDACCNSHTIEVAAPTSRECFDTADQHRKMNTDQRRRRAPTRCRIARFHRGEPLSLPKFRAIEMRARGTISQPNDMADSGIGREKLLMFDGASKCEHTPSHAKLAQSANANNCNIDAVGRDSAVSCSVELA